MAGAGLLITVAAIECTFSRSGFVALLVGAACGRAVLPASLAQRGAVAGLRRSCCCVLAPRPYLARLATFGAPQADASLQGRVGVWQRRGADADARDPCSVRAPARFVSTRRPAAHVRRSSHNILLEVAAELGIVGLAAYGWLVLAALLRLHRLRRAATDVAWLGIAATGVQAALLAYLAAGLSLSAPFASPLFVLFGLSLAIDRCGAEEDAA